MDPIKIVIGLGTSASMYDCVILINFNLFTRIKHIFAHIFNFSVIYVFDISIFFVVVGIPHLNFCRLLQQAKAMLIKELMHTRGLLLHLPGIHDRHLVARLEGCLVPIGFRYQFLILFLRKLLLRRVVHLKLGPSHLVLLLDIAWYGCFYGGCWALNYRYALIVPHE